MSAVVKASRLSGASKGTADDAKCVTEIIGDKNKEVKGDKIYLCVSRDVYV